MPDTRREMRRESSSKIIDCKMTLLFKDRADSEEGKGNGENIQGSEWTDSHLLGLNSGGKQYTEQLLKVQDTSCGPTWG